MFIIKKYTTAFSHSCLGGACFTVIQTAAISALAYLFAESLNSIIHLPPLLPSLADINIGGVFHPFANLNVKTMAIVLIILLTWINTKGIKTGASVSMGILLIVFGSLFTIIAFGLTSGHSDISSISMQTTNNSTVTISGIFTAMLGAFWAYQGWAAVGYVGGEIKDAKKNIPRGIAIGIFTIIGLYLLVNATYLSLLPIPELEEIYHPSNSLAAPKIAAVEAVRTFWGENGALFISSLIMITTLGCCNATVFSSSRPYYAMAKEGLFFKKVAKLNDKHAPANSLLYQCIWACILVLSGTFDQLTDMIIFAIFIYYGATTLGVFILRKKMPEAPRPYKVWGYPIVPAIVILFCVGLVFNTIYTQPREAGIGMVLMLTGVPMYWWFKKKNIQSETAATIDQ